MPNHLKVDVDLSYARPWFPGLAERLVNSVLAPGSDAAKYSTHGWIGVDQTKLSSDRNDPPLSLLETPPPVLVQSYAALGLRFAGPPGVPEETLLQQAWSYLSDVPDVGTAVFALVRAIHLLESPGPNYDISHSDPDLPCSIFLSLPVGEPHAALRAAESILHEAMHLQLTLLEAEVPVVQLSSSTLYSPWQRRQRPISGVVHGLYVFVAIEVYLSELLLQGDLPRDSASFALKRCREIAEEIEQAAVVAAHEDLTLFGRRFTEGLIAGRQRRGWGGGRSLGR